MGGLYPLSRMQQFDQNGEMLVGARLFLFDGGTTTPRVGYRDSSLTTAHPNPIIADASSRLPLIYLADGFYRQRLTTASGVVVFDDDGIPVLSTTVAGTGTSVDPASTLKTRDVKVRFAASDEIIDGYVRLNGRTIGSVASGATERANADTQSLYEELWGYPNIAVTGGKGSSGPADFLANKPMVLPNCAGRGIFGMDDMGAGAQGVLTGATMGNPTQVGSYGGAQTVTIAQGNLPVYTLTGGSSGNFTVSGTAAAVTVDHSHHMDFYTENMDRANPHHHDAPARSFALSDSGTGNNSGGGGGAFGVVQQIGLNTANTDISHLHRVLGDTGGTNGGVNATLHGHSFSWTGSAPNISISSGGSGSFMTNLPPIMTFMIYVRL